MGTSFISIDDTDTQESIGTGRLARKLAEQIEEMGIGKVHGVTRHQLLLHKDIPYTSNNGNACLEVRDCEVTEIYETAIEFLGAYFIPGSDPGLCICPKEMVTQEMIRFGKSAQRRVLSKEEAYQIARQADIFLEELGGTGHGVIGALAGIGLRANGNDGRFIELHGIREILGKIQVRDILRATAIELVVDLQGNRLPDEAIVDSVGWLRPYLRKRVPTLIVGGPIVQGIKDDSEDLYVPVRL